MKVAVLRFPGSNCDQDAFFAIQDDLGLQAEYVWYESTSLAGFDAVFIPGGFSYGDYLRCGAMAAQAPVMAEVERFAKEGRPVIGACNGFQVLCEARLLPGALLLNAKQKFLCQNVFLRAETNRSPWTEGVTGVISLPIAHGEGRFFAEPESLKSLLDNDQIAFRYCLADGTLAEAGNPNGSAENIAGVLNVAGNVLGMMPHPERATRSALGGIDGLMILKALTKALSLVGA